jgi:osmoprotectant transport system substrate-binding protein
MKKNKGLQIIIFGFLTTAILLSACAPTASIPQTGAATSSPQTGAATSTTESMASTATTESMASTSTPQTLGSTATPEAMTSTTIAQAGNTGTIVMGSKDFTEEFIVAEMYAQVLENAGFTVERKLNLGGTPIAQQAIVNHQIDIYPEYTSTGLLTVLKQSAMQDPQQIFQAVKTGYESKFGLTWLNPSPFNDTQALAMTKKVADQYGIKTYSDLSQKAPQLILGGPAEFMDREDGIKGLQKAYGGFAFKAIKQLGTGSLRYQALMNGQVDVVVAFGTDGAIKGNDLLLLKDDKTFYPIYNVAPVIRQDTLKKYPMVADVLNKLAPMLTDDVMSGLNWQVDGPDKMEPAAVAKAFLVQNKLVK